MKKVNHTKIRSNLCYQYNELAQVLGVSLTTIRNWKRAGMKVLEEGSRPLLVMGFEVIRFLAQRKQKRKVHIQKGEIFCRNCLASRKSKPDTIKIEQTGKKIGKANQIIVRGICEVCEAKMIKFSTDVKLAEQSLIIIGNDTPSETLYLEVEKRTECNINNEKVKIRFYQWAREADGLSELTINGISHAINLYEEHTGYEDFRLFNSNKATEFKKKLRERICRGKLISNSTYRTYLKYLKKFFSWLSMQPGYKSKIRGDSISYFNLRKKEDRVAYQYIRPDYPMPDYCLKLAKSIETHSEIDTRDKALLSLIFQTGMRPMAVTTLPLQCIDIDKMCVFQDPKYGVETKFSKYIASKIFNFDDELTEHIKAWVRYLGEKGFSSHHPFFPSAKNNRTSGQLTFINAVDVQPIFLKNTRVIRDIFFKRCKTAGMKYYPPRTYRHTTIYNAIKFVSTGEELKALSQHFGHEDIRTTLSIYGNLDEKRLFDILDNIKFNGDKQYSPEEKQKALNVLKSALGNTFTNW